MKWFRAAAPLVILGCGCTLVPAAQEREHAASVLRAQPDVREVRIGCDGGFLARSELCADVTMADGARLRFAGVGARSFGSSASRVLVTEAGGLVPRVTSCTGEPARAADVHRSGVFGHHFAPGLLDINEAIRLHKEVIEELEFWPRCPLFWEVQDKRGANHRYCAHAAKVEGEAPPRPDCR